MEKKYVNSEEKPMEFGPPKMEGSPGFDIEPENKALYEVVVPIGRYPWTFGVYTNPQYQQPSIRVMKELPTKNVFLWLHPTEGSDVARGIDRCVDWMETHYGMAYRTIALKGGSVAAMEKMKEEEQADRIAELEAQVEKMKADHAAEIVKLSSAHIAANGELQKRLDAKAKLEPLLEEAKKLIADDAARTQKAVMLDAQRVASYNDFLVKANAPRS